MKDDPFTVSLLVGENVWQSKVSRLLTFRVSHSGDSRAWRGETLAVKAVVRRLREDGIDARIMKHCVPKGMAPCGVHREEAWVNVPPVDLYRYIQDQTEAETGSKWITLEIPPPSRKGRA